MRRLALAVVLIGTGCAKKDMTPVPQARKAGHPELHCVKDTHPAGGGPPNAFETWCHKVTPTGNWIREGPAILWHANGTKAAMGEYASGRRNGQWEFWFPTGEVQKKGNYANGVEEGIWVAFHPDGSRRSEGAMVDGKPHGDWMYWEEDGSTHTKGGWVLGDRDGVWLDFDTREQPTRERIYRQGRLISMREL